RDAGYQVIFAKGYALDGSDAYCETPPQFWRDRALEAARAEADAYLISCANIAVLGVVEEIEARLDRPVVTSNQSVIWDTVSRLRATQRTDGAGRLFGTNVQRSSSSLLAGEALHWNSLSPRPSA